MVNPGRQDGMCLVRANPDASLIFCVEIEKKKYFQIPVEIETSVVGNIVFFAIDYFP